MRTVAASPNIPPITLVAEDLQRTHGARGTLSSVIKIDPIPQIGGNAPFRAYDRTEADRKRDDAVGVIVDETTPQSCSSSKPPNSQNSTSATCTPVESIDGLLTAVQDLDLKSAEFSPKLLRPYVGARYASKPVYRAISLFTEDSTGAALFRPRALLNLRANTVIDATAPLPTDGEDDYLPVAGDDASTSGVLLKLDPWNLQFLGQNADLNALFLARNTLRRSLISAVAVFWELCLTLGAFAAILLMPSISVLMIKEVSVFAALFIVSTATSAIISYLPVSDLATHQSLQRRRLLYSASLFARLCSSLVILSSLEVSIIMSDVPHDFLSLIVCGFDYSLLSITSFCYGMTFSHYRFAVLATVTAASAVLASTRPVNWYFGLPLFALVLVFETARFYRWERQLREAFQSTRHLQEHRARTRSMLHAILPPRIADQMATREMLRILSSDVAAKQNTKTPRTLSNACGAETPPAPGSPGLRLQEPSLDGPMLNVVEDEEGLETSGGANVGVRGDPFELGGRSAYGARMRTDDTVLTQETACGHTNAAGIFPGRSTPRPVSGKQHFGANLSQVLENLEQAGSKSGDDAAVATVPSSALNETAIQPAIVKQLVHPMRGLFAWCAPCLCRTLCASSTTDRYIMRTVRTSRKYLPQSSLTARDAVVTSDDLCALGQALSQTYRKAHVHQVALLAFDLVGFTAMSGDLGPQAVLTLLDRIYSSFDRIVQV
jgi:hypothetical protein